MVSYIPSTQSLLYNHMSSFVDYRTDKEPEICINSGSIYSIIASSPSFSKFKKIVENAKMIGIFNDIQANFTLFLPSDDYLKDFPDWFFETMDDGLAKQIINSSIIPKILKRDLLTSSPVCYFYTKNPGMRMYVTNINYITELNRCTRVVRYDINCTNGVIHLIDNLIIPNDDHFMN
jgi:hypothetical protein